MSRDLAVARLQLDRPLHYYPGQYVNVHVPVPPPVAISQPSHSGRPNGRIEFHVRVVPGGLVSNAIVGETRPGDQWRLSGPPGAFRVDRDG
ncbi:FAD-binding oxidoreductase [Mycobacterium tuberculosis]